MDGPFPTFRSADTKEAGKTIKTIEDVSFQANLLACDVAVASRAGILFARVHTLCLKAA